MQVAVLGTGLVGASVGLALARLDDITAVVGWDISPDALAMAKERGALTHIASGPPEAVADADVVVLAVPVSEIAATAALVGPHLKAGAILTDVASVKGDVVRALERAAPAGVEVIGGHPMAGSHEHGAAHATADLFVGATWLLTPTERTAAGAYQTLTRMVAAMGARPLAVAPDDHDLLVAVISHLPQLAATTLMNLAAERARRQHAGLLLLAAGGFRDATRVAASNPDLWLDVCRQNRSAIVAVLDEYAARIGQLRMALFDEDDDLLVAQLVAAREARRSLPGKETVSGQLVELVIPVPDRPGVIAEVATTLGSFGVNIEDLSMQHAPEGGRGRLILAVASPEAAEIAREALQARGYDVVERAA